MTFQKKGLKLRVDFKHVFQEAYDSLLENPYPHPQQIHSSLEQTRHLQSQMCDDLWDLEVCNSNICNIKSFLKITFSPIVPFFSFKVAPFFS